MDVRDFVLEHLPKPPAHVLEVGCGAGQLAKDMAEVGYKVTAIDPEAPEGNIFRRVSLEEFPEGGLFDAIVANRSLHHIESIEDATDRIRTLLPSGGLVILNEFAWDQMDEATARWYLSHVKDLSPKEKTLLPGNFPDAWVAEHDGLHTGPAMRGALDRRFELQLFEWMPYIAHYYLEREDLVAKEQQLIYSGTIKPLGFRYVGVRN
jgi:SAM-dependent methyltransferase